MDREHHWHNGAKAEIGLYVQSLRKAAKLLVENIEKGDRTDWDVCPPVLLYRQALELQLKFMIGEGSNFLKERTDHISLRQTRSLRWLAQLVGQIIKAVGWQEDFICDGITSLDDFKKFIDHVERFEPVDRSIILHRNVDVVPHYYRTFDIATFSVHVEALLDLLNVMAKSLAAKWDLQQKTLLLRNIRVNPIIQ